MLRNYGSIDLNLALSAQQGAFHPYNAQMDKKQPPNSSIGDSQDWQAYWSGALKANAFGLGGTHHPVVKVFWQKYFQSVVFSGSRAEIVDIASGSGAVLDQAAGIIPADMARLTCIDISFEAVKGVTTRLPGVQGVVADACSLPLSKSCIDIAVSQFGIEYAGIEAVVALLDVVKPGGQIALLIHHQSGAIFRECADNHAAIREVQKIGFVDSANEMFECAFHLLEGGDRASYEKASRDLIPAFRSMEDVMRRYGKHVAADTVRRLCLDVNDIHTNLPRYNKTAVGNWLRGIAVELERYAGRMSSMCQAALDDVSFHRLVEEVKGFGFTVELAKPLDADNLELPIAWSLIAQKG